MDHVTVTIIDQHIDTYVYQSLGFKIMAKQLTSKELGFNSSSFLLYQRNN